MTRPPERLVLLGYPVAHSLSPPMHNAALREAGIALRYAALEVAPAALAKAVLRLVSERAAGNVTVPHKASVAALCDRLTTTAARAAAVNTFWVDDDGGLVGDNTDVPGFDTVARGLIGETPSDIRMLLLGAGGSAAAVLTAAEQWPGSEVAIWSRTPARAAALADRFPKIGGVTNDLATAAASASFVVNATPVGLTGDAMPMAPHLSPSGCVVMDLVYRSGETAWVRAARARGLRAADGLPMLVEQGALAFERWFGRAPDREAMWNAVR